MALNYRKHGAEGGNRTRTPLARPRILSPSTKTPKLCKYVISQSVERFSISSIVRFRLVFWPMAFKDIFKVTG